MKIAILGTRGIPNNHGGFEQFAEYFSVYLSVKGHEVYVYNSHEHPYRGKDFKGVNIVHAYDPEYKIGTAGQFVYDLNCIMDSRKRNFDAILQLGYTSNAIWYWLLPKKSVIVTNMDGMEWKRSKYSKIIRKFLKYAEKLAIRSSNYLIADSIGIKEYIAKTYNKPSEFIAYGASVFKQPNETVLTDYKVNKHEYCLIIARLEPENNIKAILEGYCNSNTPYPLIIFGTLNRFGKQLQRLYVDDKRIQFVGANYNQDDLNNLRYYSRYYFHGHSVGGTNPSLLEAMASNSLIVANDNIFNRSILGEDAQYFSSSKEIENLLNEDLFFEHKEKLALRNKKKVENLYDWDIINQAYEEFILRALNPQ